MSTTDPERRLDGLRQAMDNYPKLIEETSARLASIAGQTVTGHDPGRQVSVTVTAVGVVTGVRFSERALRHAADHELAAAVQDAANAALADAEKLLESAATPPGMEDLDEQMAAFEARMDRILDNLDDVERRIDRQGL